ncbi:MAG: hypothetical protein DFNUSKGM_000538 [Candidatus Fervidibacter sacchari]
MAFTLEFNLISKFVRAMRGKVVSTFPHTLSTEPTSLEAASSSRTGKP